MEQVKQVAGTAAETANRAGVGPDNTSTISNTVSKGIDAVQSSVFGQGKKQEQQSSEEPRHDPAVSQAVDGAHDASVEEFQRHTHRSEPVTDDVEKAQP